MTDELNMPREKAREAWKEYCELLKKHDGDQVMRDLKNIYYQLSQGRQVIDAYSAIIDAGLWDSGFPKLAICRADGRFCHVHRRENGGMVFLHDQIPTRSYGWRDKVILPQGSFKWNTPLVGHNWSWSPHESRSRRTIVPHIPTKFYPDSKLSNFYIMWETDEHGWEPVPEPPGDPLLLKRITRNLFVILAAWDLTDIEKAVIKGAMYQMEDST